MSKYDVILAEHVQNAKEKPKCVTYFSISSQNKIINLLGKTIEKKITSEIKDAKYFTIMLDSTPDIGHEKQVSEILRDVHIDEDRKVKIKEVFLGFFQIDKKDAGSLVNKQKLKQNKISIIDCRGQTYDNAAVMVGVRGNVQQKILEVNSKAVFLNCENHSLNLGCVHASGVLTFCCCDSFWTSGRTVHFFFFICVSLGSVKIIYLSDCEKTMSNKMEFQIRWCGSNIRRT